MALSRFAESLSSKNARTSSAVGSLPVRSSEMRRRNMLSSHGAEGGIPSFEKLANASSSIKLRGFGNWSSTFSPIGILARKTPT